MCLVLQARGQSESGRSVGRRDASRDAPRDGQRNRGRGGHLPACHSNDDSLHCLSSVGSQELQVNVQLMHLLKAQVNQGTGGKIATSTDFQATQAAIPGALRY